VPPRRRRLLTHVKIGHGRHYSDVPPIKGVYRGGATAELEASALWPLARSQVEDR
jgi:hypothetical protein